MEDEAESRLWHWQRGMLGRTWWWLWLDLKFLSPNPESSCFFVQRSFSAHLSRFGSCRDLAYFSIQFSSDFFDPADLTILILLGSRLDAFEGKCVRGGYCYDHANSGMNPASSLPSRDPSPASPVFVARYFLYLCFVHFATSLRVAFAEAFAASYLRISGSSYLLYIFCSSSDTYSIWTIVFRLY